MNCVVLETASLTQVIWGWVGPRTLSPDPADCSSLREFVAEQDLKALRPAGGELVFLSALPSRRNSVFCFLISLIYFNLDICQPWGSSPPGCGCGKTLQVTELTKIHSSSSNIRKCLNEWLRQGKFWQPSFSSHTASIYRVGTDRGHSLHQTGRFQYLRIQT